MNRLRCKRCKYLWTPRKRDVRVCANKECRSIYWDREKKKQVIKIKEEETQESQDTAEQSVEITK